MFSEKLFSEVRDERGLALVVALMLLVLMTVMGIAAISTTSTELKLTGNERTDAQAFHTAEAGIKEILYRSALYNLGAGPTSPVAAGGTFVNPDGTPFDGSIRDLNEPPDINWRVKVYFRDPPPAPPNASVSHVRSILPQDMWSQLKYSNDGDPALDDEVLNVRYLVESEVTELFGITPADLNADGDTLDLVYYDITEVDPRDRRKGAGNPGGTGGVADTAPPPGVSKNRAIRLVESWGYGFRSNVKKRILLETTGFPVNPQANSAVQTAFRANFGGNGFISGFNHNKNTTRDDAGNTDSSQFENNGCENYSGGSGGTGTCEPAYAGDGNDPDMDCSVNPCVPIDPAAYSGMWKTDGHKAAVLSGEDPTTSGSSELWGGETNPSDPSQNTGWKNTQPGLDFPTLEQMLDMKSADVDEMLSRANTDPDSCPRGVTYIDNENSQQTYNPTRAPGCEAGSGILIVTGDMKIPSNWDFKGLIYVMGDAELRGNVFILGSMAVKGEAGLQVAAGSPTLLYSYDAVFEAVEAALASNGFALTTISWREF